MEKVTKIILIAITAVLIMFAVFGIIKLKENTDNDLNNYYVVYLENGDTYYGHYSSGKMSDVWIVGKNENGDIVASSIKDLPIGLEGSMSINYDKIVSVVKLRDDSPIVKTIKENIE